MLINERNKRLRRREKIRLWIKFIKVSDLDFYQKRKIN